MGLAELGLGRGQVGLGLAQPLLGKGAIHQEEHVALVDGIAFVDLDLDHAARLERRQRRESAAHVHVAVADLALLTDRESVVLVLAGGGLTVPWMQREQRRRC